MERFYRCSGSNFVDEGKEIDGFAGVIIDILLIAVWLLLRL